MNEKELNELMKSRGYYEVMETGTATTFTKEGGCVYCTVKKGTKEFQIEGTVHGMMKLTPGYSGPIDNDKLFNRLEGMVSYYTELCKNNKYEFKAGE